MRTEPNIKQTPKYSPRLSRPGSFRRGAIALAAASLLAAALGASAITVTTTNGVGADRGVSECNYNINVLTTTTNFSSYDAASSGTAGDLNGRWVSASPFTNHINEIIALRFDLTGYALPAYTNFQIELINHRANTARVLHYYGVSNGVSGGNNNGTVTNWTDDDWSESSSALKFSTLPGAHFDGSSATKGLSNTVDLGSATMNSTAKGSSVTFSSAALTTFIQTHPNSVVTILVSVDTSSTGQSRFASKEATALDAGSPTGAAGDFAPRLNFVPSCQTAVVTTDPTNQTVSVSQTAQFTLVAQGSNPAYQWQISTNSGFSWDALANATNASYTTPAATTNDNGSQFRCIMNVACDSSSATSAVATLTVTVPKNLVWVGDGSANLWDTTTANWTGDATTFAVNDNVRIDDSGNNALALDLVGTITPSQIIVSNVTKDFTIGSLTGGTLGGGASLTKNGAGKLTLTTDNSFTGKTVVNGGTLSINNAVKLGASPGAFVADQLTLDGATLEFTGSTGINANRGTTIGSGGARFDIPSGVLYTNSGAITGPGSLTKLNAGTLTLPVANSYAGGTVISNGTLAVGNGGALGGGAVSLAGGTLSFPGAQTITNNVDTLASSTLTFGSTANNAVVLNGALTGAGGTTLTITPTGASTTGTRVRLGSGITNTFTYDGDINLNGTFTFATYNHQGTHTFNGVISGSGAVGRRSTLASTAGITVLNGNNTYSGGTAIADGAIGFGLNSTGAPVTSGPIGTGTLTFESNVGTLQRLFASGGARTVGNNIAWSTGTDMNLIIEGSNPLTLTGDVDLGGNVRTITSSNSATTILSGVISNGGLTKAGPGVLLLNGASTYVGTTTVGGGTLGGTGSIAGSVVVNAGGDLAPGASIGTLTVNGDLTLNGTITAEVNSTNAQTADLVTGVNAVTYGGTLVVANTGPALTAANTFQLFAATNYSGAFASISPSAPGAGLAWNTNTLTTDGVLRINTASSIPTYSTNLTFSAGGGNLTINWPSTHTGWSLQAQTNSRSVGLVAASNAWFTLPGYETTNTAVITVNPANPTVFYRLFYAAP